MIHLWSQLSCTINLLYFWLVYLPQYLLCFPSVLSNGGAAMTPRHLHLDDGVMGEHCEAVYPARVWLPKVHSQPFLTSFPGFRMSLQQLPCHQSLPIPIPHSGHTVAWMIFFLTCKFDSVTAPYFFLKQTQIPKGSGLPKAWIWLGVMGPMVSRREHTIPQMQCYSS